MNAEDWSERADFSAVCRRAGGRRRYNAWRRFRAAYRRMQVVKLWIKYPPLMRGLQSRLAAELGVSRSTICRDMAYLLRLGWPCPQCGAYAEPPKPLFVDDPEEDDEEMAEGDDKPTDDRRGPTATGRGD
ncbi:MAG: hypothetical protein ACRELG_02145 [Gemmataceae bacterium]